MNLRQYSYILEILNSNGVTAAAQKLFISQSSLSQYLSKIENELGAPLFDRKTTPISLTAAGHIYIETARQILDLDNEMRRHITDISSYKKGILRVGMSYSRATYMFPKIYSTFKKKYPFVDIDLYQKNVYELQNAVTENKIGFAILPTLAVNSELASIAIYNERLMLICKKGYLCNTGYKKGDCMPLHVLKDISFILLSEGTKIRKICDDIFSIENLNINKVIETATNEGAAEFVEAGLGVAILPHTVLDSVYRFYDFDYFEIPSQNAGWTVSAVHKASYNLNVFEKDFIAMLKEYFHD